MTNGIRVIRVTEATGTDTGNPTRESVTDPASLEGRVEMVRRAWWAMHDGADQVGDDYITDVYADHVIVNAGGGYVRRDYTINADHSVTFGDPQRVTVDVTFTPADTTEPVTESVEPVRLGTETASIVESLDDGSGWIWRVTMIRPGMSPNRANPAAVGRRYRAEVLREAATLYEGARAFDGHRDHATRRASSVAGLVGWHENVTVNESTGALEADFHIAESAPHIRQLFLTAWRSGRPDLVGFSHDARAAVRTVTESGRVIEDVSTILAVNSVDVVADPAAGGRIERLVASENRSNTMDPREFLARLRAGTLTEAEIAEAVTDQALAAVHEAFTASTPAAPTAPASTPVTEAAPAGPLTPLAAALYLREAADQWNLPEAAREVLRARTFTTEAEIVEAVESVATLWAAAAGATPAPLAGQTAPQVVEAEESKMRTALDRMIDPQNPALDRSVPAFRSLKEAYAAFTGRTPYSTGLPTDSEDFNRVVLAESIGAVASPAARLTESLTTTSWAEALGDSMTRRLIRAYENPMYGTWREIVSEFSTINDFRSNKRVRVGGYDTLPVVGQASTYQPLDSPTDEEAAYSIIKRGGTEDYTLEMVANDDLGALRRIPTDLGRAAALTLYLAVWNTTIAGNAAIYDGNNLFDDANHGNDNTSSALAEATLSVLRRRMIRQKRLGEDSGFLGAMPAILAHPPELHATAFKLVESGVAVVASENATTPNPYRGMRTIEVPTFTDANDWYLIADPSTVPTIEVGFYQGRQDPELLVQDQPNVGAVFTADKFTWKIRHIWGLAVLDYRGFQRAQG